MHKFTYAVFGEVAQIEMPADAKRSPGSEGALYLRPGTLYHVTADELAALEKARPDLKRYLLDSEELPEPKAETPAAPSEPEAEEDSSEEVSEEPKKPAKRQR